MEGLKKFLFRGDLVQLAVAVVVGAQFSALVTQFVNSFINPLLALVGGNPGTTWPPSACFEKRSAMGAFGIACLGNMRAA